jgi:hypothetical protein
VAGACPSSNRGRTCGVDHRKAVIVAEGRAGEDIQRVPSHMQKQVRFSGGAQAVSAEDIRDRKVANHLGQYYAEVTSRIREAESILLLGPGAAKIELKHHLEREGLGERIMGVDTVDRMIDRQIAAKVRQCFARSGK